MGWSDFKKKLSGKPSSHPADSQATAAKTLTAQPKATPPHAAPKAEEPTVSGNEPLDSEEPTPRKDAAPAVDRVPSTEAQEPDVPVGETKTTPEKLWDAAYQGLKDSDEDLVKAYETILSARLSNKNIESNEAWTGGSTIGETPETRKDQMKKAIDVGLKSSEKFANFKGKISEGADAIANVKGLIDQAVKASPEASVAWAGVSFGLEIIANPITQPGLNRKGLSWVLARMEWYWKLADLLLDENRNKETSTKDLRDQLEKHIVKLYQSLLSYQMKSIYLYHLHWAKVILRDLFKLDDWAGQVTGIEKAEKAVLEDSKTYNTEHIKSQLSGLLEFSKAQVLQLQDINRAIQDQTEREEQRYQDEKDLKCLQELRVVDPQVEKDSIEKKKGGLLEGSYAWILKPFSDFHQSDQQKLFWIKGEPGKGKTMMMCGLIDHLKSDVDHGDPCLTYFFCQEPEANQNNATAVLRGLIWMLASQRPSLIKHARKTWDTSGAVAFSEKNASVTLAKILTNMLQDESAKGAIVAIDALDECRTNRDELLDIIATLSSATKATWVVSSRPWKDIEDKFASVDKTTLDLRDHDNDLSQAIEFYIEHKIQQLEKTISQKNIDVIRPHLINNANGTFLWVGLVCTELTKSGVANYDAVDIAKEFPAELNPLYKRMMEGISVLRRAKTCYQILGTICTVYRYLSISELQTLIQDLGSMTQDDVVHLVESCGSFLSVRGDVVSLVHQSAKDFLIENAADEIFPSQIVSQHQIIFETSISVLSSILKQNIYDLEDLGISTEQASPPNPDPLASIKYCLLFWDEHFIEYQSQQNSEQAVGALIEFLEEHLLHWLEALSLIGGVSDSVTAFQNLKAFVEKDDTSELAEIVRDSHRFIVTFRHAIEAAPLQVYAAPLIFSPSESQVRNLFRRQRPPQWTFNDIPLEEKWNASTFTLEHSGEQVKSTVFSADGKLLFSVSSTGKVRTWDTATGDCLDTIGNENKSWSSVLLCDGKPRAFSRAMEGKIHVLDLTTGTEIQTLDVPDIEYPEVIGTNTSKTVVIGSSDVITIWKPDTAELLDTINLRVTKRTAGSPLDICNNRLAISSIDLFTSTVFIKIWDLQKKKCVRTMEGHKRNLDWLVYAGDDSRLISASYDETIKLWDVDRQKCLQTFQAENNRITQAIPLDKGKRMMLGAADGALMIWDVKTGVCIDTLHAHSSYVESLSSSPKYHLLASGSRDGTVKIWDMTQLATQGLGHIHDNNHTSASEVHVGQVNAIAVSNDGRYAASGGADGKIMIWDAHDGVLVTTMQGHAKPICSIAFSENGKQLATASEDFEAKVWDVEKGTCIHTLIHAKKEVNAAIFHPDGSFFTASSDGLIRLWDLETESCAPPIQCEEEPVLLVLSDDGERLASLEQNGRVRLWDVATGDPVPIPEAFSVSDSDTPVYEFRTREHPALRTQQAAFPIQSLAQNQRWSTREPRKKKIDLTSVLRALLEGKPEFSAPDGFSVSDDKSWIVRDGKKILWLPAEFRPSSVAIEQSTVALGCHGGQVLVLHFPEDSFKLESD
ncbi:unnamed protein product [Clonostachys byssicola]|uniref:NACHT domain-containing protein n=1 Tax=Clonostachys byssicola TaxID=160290 RepID=A0A9N9Y637_9HYPO|nr:unnamed protein product [Clonostachys byssicola]